MPDDQMPKIILTTAPLQPVPKAQPSPQPLSASDQTQQRRIQVQAELEKLQQEESSLLNNMKDWLAKVQGSETKQQALERELFELDHTTPTGPKPEEVKAELQKQLQQAEAKVKQIVNQQKIDEKKAFDNYSAGGLDRQGLLEEMDRVSQRYADAQAAAKQTATQLQQQMAGLEQPLQPTPTPPPAPEPSPVVTAPTSTITSSTFVQKLITLPEVQTGPARQLLIDLPNQGTMPIIERAADGNGIIITSGGVTGFMADADLLRAGATAEDMMSLPISQQSSTTVASLIPPAAL